MASRPCNLNISRRTFLMGALAAASLPSVFTTRQGFAASGPNDTMLLGCIGVGRQCRLDMQQAIYQGLDANARVVAVCDVDSTRLEKGRDLVNKIYSEQVDKGAGYTDCMMYSDFREMLARPDLDGVIIGTPDHWHALAAIAAVRAGKDVYLEKPLTFTIREGQELVRAVRRTDRILQTGSQQRSSIYFRKACEIVRNGFIGNLNTVRVKLEVNSGTGDGTVAPVPENLNYDMWMGPTEVAPYAVDRAHSQTEFNKPGWMQNERYCRGMITNWGAHMNDIAQWANGTDDSGLAEIEAKGEFPDRGLFDVHTTFQAEGQFTNGVKLYQESGKHVARFEGDEGWVEVSRRGLEASDQKILRSKVPSDGVHLYQSKDHMLNFLECMRTRKEPVAPVEVGHRSNSVCVVTHIAMKLGRKLQWDPKTETFTDDHEANAMLDYKHREPWKLL